MNKTSNDRLTSVGEDFSTGSRTRRANGLRKAACVAPGLVISTLMVLLVGPALPDWAGTVLFYGGLAATALLIAGVGEPTAIRVLFGARQLTDSERAGLEAAVTELAQLGIAPFIGLFVARRPGAPAAIAHGRRSVVMASELVHGILTGRLQQHEAVSVIAHAGIAARSGLSRQDPAIVLWSAPWRILTVLGRPVRDLLGFAWKLRFIIFGVGIWQSLTDSSSNPGPLNGPMSATALALILALTYLMPRWTVSWDNHVAGTSDRELVARGLGPSIAAFLRRYPQTPTMIERIQRLDPPARQPTRLRLVHT